MSRLYIFNSANFQLGVTGDDDNNYFLPPKKITPLPEGVKVKGSMNKKLKITKPPQAR